MKLERSAGILLHITSLPNENGIGTMGKEAIEFIDQLSETGFKYWQILPFGPVSLAQGSSPYASTSTFAGNKMLISCNSIEKEDWYTGKPYNFTEKDSSFVDFEKVDATKNIFLEEASENFFLNAPLKEKQSFEKFCYENSFWLDNYALFTVLSKKYNTNSWINWKENKNIKFAIDNQINSEDELKQEKFIQYMFFTQFKKIKEHANKKGIQIIGDIPIYVNFDSCDTWSNKHIFELDKDLKPPFISGVPPDYFSKTGQRWGNPLYKWFDKSKSLFSPTVDWWESRIKHLTQYVDVIRIDHFRGFESFWSIPSNEETAIKGKWMPGPGIDFFTEIKKRLGYLPFIAEDLGIITPEVEALRDSLNLPGMKILQFAFDQNNKNSYLPHSITNTNCILYTGTHDNNTTNGWFYENEINKETQEYIMEYLDIEDFDDFSWHLIKAAFRTTARLVIIPAQDILGYGKKFRMNTPGTTVNNWKWKLQKNVFDEKLQNKFKRIIYLYDRK